MSVCLSVHGQLVKMLITLESHSIFILHIYLFSHCPVTGMQNSGEALSSFISACQGMLMKLLITLIPHSIF